MTNRGFKWWASYATVWWCISLIVYGTLTAIQIGIDLIKDLAGFLVSLI